MRKPWRATVLSLGAVLVTALLSATAYSDSTTTFRHVDASAAYGGFTPDGGCIACDVILGTGEALDITVNQTHRFRRETAYSERSTRMRETAQATRLDDAYIAIEPKYVKA